MQRLGTLPWSPSEINPALSLHQTSLQAVFNAETQNWSKYIELVTGRHSALNGISTLIPLRLRVYNGRGCEHQRYRGALRMSVALINTLLLWLPTQTQVTYTGSITISLWTEEGLMWFQPSLKGYERALGIPENEVPFSSVIQPLICYPCSNK